MRGVALIAWGAALWAPIGAAAADRSAPCLSSVAAYFDLTPGDCPLRWGPIRLYGALDVGAGFSSHGAAFNPNYPQGVQELIARFSNGRMWQLVPNGLQRSHVGLEARAEIARGWYGLGGVDADFDPLSLRLANGPASLVDNNARTLANQSANGDSSRAGQFDNTLGYVGVSNQTFGALTVGRLNSFSADLVSAYDPMQGAYAFSLIGNSATYVSGVGYTETTRYESAVKYRWSGAGFRAGAVWQFGGYGLGNGSNGAFQADIGADFGALSLDAVYSHARDAVSLSLYGADPLPAGVSPNDLKATLADIDGAILAGRYRAGAWTLYGGYEYARFAPPSDAYPGGFSTLGGYRVPPGAANATAYLRNKHLQVGWLGARYALRPDLEFAGAYYLAHQDDYAPQNAKPGVCRAGAAAYCAGSLQAVSALLDLRAWRRVVLYGGAMYSFVSGGMASGFLHNVNFAPTVGLRVSF